MFFLIILFHFIFISVSMYASLPAMPEVQVPDTTGLQATLPVSTEPAQPVTLDAATLPAPTLDTATLTAPAQDATVLPAPTPDATATALTPAPAPTETAPIQAEQLKWPDAIELAEDTKGVSQTSNTKIIEAYKTAEKTVFECLKKNNDIIKKNNQLREKFETTDNTIDPFIQETETLIGKLREIFNPSQKSN